MIFIDTRRSCFEIDMRKESIARKERNVPSTQVSNYQCLACVYSHLQNRAGQSLEDRDDCRGSDAINGILHRTRGSIVLHAQCRSGRSRRVRSRLFRSKPHRRFPPTRHAAVDLKPRSNGMFF